METLQEKANKLLAGVFGGLHNVPGKIKDKKYLIEVAVDSQLATFDSSRLTKLVFLAHDLCVRVELIPCNFQRLRIHISERKRGGGMSEGHPTLEEHYRKHLKQMEGRG